MYRLPRRKRASCRVVGSSAIRRVLQSTMLNLLRSALHNKPLRSLLSGSPLAKSSQILNRWLWTGPLPVCPLQHRRQLIPQGSKCSTGATPLRYPVFKRHRWGKPLAPLGTLLSTVEPAGFTLAEGRNDELLLHGAPCNILQDLPLAPRPAGRWPSARADRWEMEQVGDAAWQSAGATKTCDEPTDAQGSVQ